MPLWIRYSGRKKIWNLRASLSQLYAKLDSTLLPKIKNKNIEKNTTTASRTKQVVKRENHCHLSGQMTSMFLMNALQENQVKSFILVIFVVFFLFLKYTEALSVPLAFIALLPSTYNPLQTLSIVTEKMT